MEIKSTEESKSLLYSKLTVFLFSIFGSVFFGAILYSMNLKVVDKKVKSYVPILFAVVYNLLFNNVANRIGINPILSLLLINSIGGLILTKLFWKEQIPANFSFENRSVINPLILIVIIWGTIIILNLIN